MTNIATFKELYQQELLIQAVRGDKQKALRNVCRRLNISATNEAIHEYITKGTISQPDLVAQGPAQ